MITPLPKRVILAPLLDKESGSIEIPDQYKQSQTAEVVAANTELPVSPGDRILFHPNAAWTNVQIEGRQLRVMHEQFLLAVMGAE